MTATETAIARSTWKTSRYTRVIEVSDKEGVLYNGFTGALIQLNQEAFARASSIFSGQNRTLDLRTEQDPLFEHFQAGGFVVEQDVDELALVKQDYREKRKDSKFVITILPTYSCNLGCDYCFVSKKTGVMSREKQAEVVRFVEERVAKVKPPKMIVDWFGGEPTLALSAMENLSNAFRDICKKHGITYYSQVITNGTRITQKTADLLEACEVDHLQITLDGPREVHDERRGYKIGNRSSFDDIIAGLEHVVGRFRVDLRINVDTRNMEETWPLLDLFEERGWLKPDNRFFPHLARVAPYTQECAWVEDIANEQKSFHDYNYRWTKRLNENNMPVVGHGLYHFPNRVYYNCGAVGDNGFLITPSGELHRCGLVTDDSKEAVGNLNEPLDETNANYRKWADYDPFEMKKCVECTYLPSCLGGCPHDHMAEKDYGRASSCVFHKRFEDEIISQHMRILRGDPEPEAQSCCSSADSCGSMSV